MTIGTANVSVLVDTGSSNLAVNPNVSTTSEDYIALNKSFTLSYGTTESNGGGTEFVRSPSPAYNPVIRSNSDIRLTSLSNKITPSSGA